MFGDLMHHPLQSTYPNWNSRFCADTVEARFTRHRFMDEYAETNTIVLAAHFASPTAGRIVGTHSQFRFHVANHQNEI